ncbi:MULTISPECIES: MerR family transcriptional regulator [unclassified Sporolactobacillus]|uniref:MerR family transcriptional regulator n=1 Tax=unclassified Sporolactobacillus TaxID=2628533 RepID=UPI002367CBE0|nr:MerR family transcriptional regulator [Sporolactobacillus sp. CQH2019]MDD9149110.1 MerR family transcriptional regulator [Sporolactobacillus sp. CQH2019]
MDFSIGDFAKLTGLSIYTLRYYEKEKLIFPGRDEHNQRRYTEKDKAWIEFILRLKETAMPLKDIQKYAKLRYEGDQTMEERLEMLRLHRLSILEKKKALENNLSHLDKKIEIYRRAILSAMK